MKNIFIAFTLICLLSCQTQHHQKDFTAFSHRFLNAVWQQYPHLATMIGKHDYDGVLKVRDAQYRQSCAAFAKAYLDSLKTFDITQLSPSQKTDYWLIKNFLEAHELTELLKSYTWDASAYNVADVLFEVINNKVLPLDKKINNVDHFLSSMPPFFAAAIQSITIPTREHTELALNQLDGTKSLLNTSIRDSFKLRKADEKNIDVAIHSIDQYRQHLNHIQQQFNKGTLTPHSFRLGKDVYLKKFAYDIQSQHSAEVIYQKAVARKQWLHKEMYRYADALWHKYFLNKTKPKDTLACIAQVIHEVAKIHTHRDSFQNEIARQIPILTQFIKDKNLLTLDSTKPLEVRKEPEWMAGVAGASVSAPGPFDKGGTTFYNVGSLSAYSPKAAESFLKEYNQYTLQILNIHEAIPGHYVQLVYANQSPSLIQSVFANGAMIEGWAVYSELMMMEAGWDKNTTINKKIDDNEMWLMYLKWHLRTVCNTILDYSVHCQNMTRDDALKLLIDEAFQEQTEAENKWKRATLTQVQLCSYFTGFIEIYEFREKLKRSTPQFNIKQFNEKLLSFGSTPIQYIETMW